MHKILATRWGLILAALSVGMSCGVVNNVDCECRLSGAYREDSTRFCPNGPDATVLELFVTALEEGSEVPRDELSLRERIAVIYDASWVVRKVTGVVHAQLAAILAVVGCPKESLDQYRQAKAGIPHSAIAAPRPSADAWGDLGIAAHLLRRYEESEQAFAEAIGLEPDYFDMRPIQTRIAEASRNRRPVLP